MTAHAAGVLEVRLLLEGFAPGTMKEERIETGSPQGAGGEEQAEQQRPRAMGPGCGHGSSIGRCPGKANLGA
jgi:hypothetical protein